MPTRLVLGCGRDHRPLVERLAGAGDVLVVVGDGADVRWLTERGVPVERAEPTDASALARVGGEPDSVIVTAGDPERAAVVREAAQAAFPGVPVLSLAGGSDDVAAGRAVDRAAPVARRALDHVASPGGQRALGLRSTLRSLEEPVAVLTHDNPDPDAIASAVALVHLAAAAGVDAAPCYFGDIAHQENRALVNLLDLDLRQLEAPADLSAFGGLALVDHARPGVNDSLPDDAAVDVVIDHHPTHGPDDVRFVDLRSGVGATSTLLTEYHDRLGVELTETVATALLYGLRVDTDDFTREAVAADFEAAATLLEHADHSVLERVESPTLTAETLEVLARAIDRRRRHDSVLTAGVGEVTDRDALAQAADRLLDLDGVHTTVVFGIIGDTVYVSARARGARVDLGETLRTAYDRLGSAGGHAEMAGAQIPTGMLVEPEDDDPAAIVEEVLTGAFLDAVETTYAPPTGEFLQLADDLSFLSTADASEGGGAPGDRDAGGLANSFDSSGDPTVTDRSGARNDQSSSGDEAGDSDASGDDSAGDGVRDDSGRDDVGDSGYSGGDGDGDSGDDSDGNSGRDDAGDSDGDGAG